MSSTRLAHQSARRPMADLPAPQMSPGGRLASRCSNRRRDPLLRRRPDCNGLTHGGACVCVQLLGRGRHAARTRARCAYPARRPRRTRRPSVLRPPLQLDDGRRPSGLSPATEPIDGQPADAAHTGRATRDHENGRLPSASAGSVDVSRRPTGGRARTGKRGQVGSKPSGPTQQRLAFGVDVVEREEREGDGEK